MTMIFILNKQYSVHDVCHTKKNILEHKIGHGLKNVNTT